MHQERPNDQQRILDLELQHARYEAGLAERRYAACDPDNRLIAVQLRKNWEAALRRVQDLQARQLGRSAIASRSSRALYEPGRQPVNGVACTGHQHARTAAVIVGVDR